MLTPEEMQRLLIQVKEDGCFELFLLELCTGLRRGEILALQRNDLNPSTGELRIERQVHRVDGKLVISQVKTKASNRSIVLPPAVISVLLEHRKGTNSRWVFHPQSNRTLLLILPQLEKDCKRFWIEPVVKRFDSTICAIPSQPHLWSMGWTSRHSLISSAMCLPQLP